MKNGLLALFALALLLAGCGAPPIPTLLPVGEEPAGHTELARRYAPVIYQGAATDQDYITAVDLDGDWIGSNNWENQSSGDLAARVYYAVTETESHWFLFYGVYHPRDYTEEPCDESDGCHENDMESLQVVVAKDGSAYGHPQALLTLAHSHIYLYPVDRSVKKGALRLRETATLEDGHPMVWIETYGHGIHGKREILVPGTVVYRVGDAAEVPEGIKDESVAYELVPIYETLWPRRKDIGPGELFDYPFDYRGQILPASFDGENWGQDRANPPWGYDQEIGDTLLRGDFFLDPARALSYFATLEGDLSRVYVHNPYLADLGLEGAP